MKKLLIIKFLLLFILSFVLLYVLKTYAGEYMTTDAIFSLLRDNGFRGILFFVFAAVIGTLLHIPAYVFLICCFLVFPDVSGLLVGFSTVVAIFSGHYWLARILKIDLSKTISNPKIQKIFQKIESYPIRSIATLRLIFFMAPWVSIVLGLSMKKYKEFIIGSILGVLVQFFAIYTIVFFSREKMLDWVEKML